MTHSFSHFTIGIDIAKAHFDVHRLPDGHTAQFPNTPQGIQAFISSLNSLSINAIVMEATGGYEKPLLFTLLEHAFPVHRINPRQIRRFAQALGHLAKTDAIDAKVIAQFGHTANLTPHHFPNQTLITLQHLQQRRDQLVLVRQQEINRLASLQQSPTIVQWIKDHIVFLDNQIQGVEAALQALIEQTPELKAKQDCLSSAKGVGPATSRQLIANLPELGQLSGKAIAALVGVAPYNRDSGTFKGKRTTYGGRQQVRKTLYMATLVATRHNPVIKTFYQRLLDNGKAKMTALVAAMRKFIVILNAMLRDNTQWNTTLT